MGPAIFTSFDVHDGRFTGPMTRTVGGPAFATLATLILNSQAWIVISTDANRDGEITGRIAMHKRYAM
jgi:hypothetical protein